MKKSLVILLFIFPFILFSQNDKKKQSLEDFYIIRNDSLTIPLDEVVIFDKRHFNSKKEKFDTLSKYVYTIGYVILPFIIITKIPFSDNIYRPKIIISIFILIWTNDTFAYIVGKSIGKQKLIEKISPKNLIVIYDIPEEKKKEREKKRARLLRLDDEMCVCLSALEPRINLICSRKQAQPSH